MTIHKEGRTLLFVLLIIFVGIIWVSDYYLSDVLRNIIIGVCTFFYLIILQFFRNPVFTVVKNPKHIIAPADGKVVVIEEVEEPEYFKGKRKQISIFMSPFNVHVNRMPVEGSISYYKIPPRKIFGCVASEIKY
jgi:phosphatidylserine decarboxylase